MTVGSDVGRWSGSGDPFDAFHLVKLGGHAVDEVRRRDQQEALGHRGRAWDRLYEMSGCFWDGRGRPHHSSVEFRACVLMRP